MPDLILVVDPSYSEQIDIAAQSAPLWIVSTPINRSACERAWKAKHHPDHREKGAITCYHTANPDNRTESLFGILDQLETHHGEVRGDVMRFPKGFVLEVIGIQSDEEIATALREFGFTSFFNTAGGFQALADDSGGSTRNSV
jgi:hypothetical protein